MSSCSCINLLTVLCFFLNVTFVTCFSPIMTLWPDRIIPFSISKDFTYSQVNQIVKDINQFNNYTCVRWLNTQICPGKIRSVEFVRIKSGSCTYGTGIYDHEKKMFIHYIKLTDLCFADHWVTHEMMHVMGFKHEHSRTDRNCYVNVNTKEVEGDYDYAIIHDSGWLEGFPYDRQSIMHYHQDERMKAIIKGITLDGYNLGRRDGKLSTLDILKVMYRYCDAPHYCEMDIHDCVNMDRFERSLGCLEH